MKSLIKDFYDLKTTCEGCLADVAIKPKEIQEDMWMMVQVKSTFKPSRGYNFKCQKAYKDCIVFYLCESDKKMWIFDGNNIAIKDKIAIGLNKSKYDEFEVRKENILDTLDDYYNNMKKYTYEYIDTPISDHQKVEREYRKYRESKITFLEFKQPMYQGMVYDFIINNYKVQEKVGVHARGKNSITCSLHKNNGRKKYTSYKKGDNEFYWLNLPDKKHFYVIPEDVLIEQKYIDIEKNRSVTLNPNKESWISPYLFNYDNLDVHKLKAMFYQDFKKED